MTMSRTHPLSPICSKRDPVITRGRSHPICAPYLLSLSLPIRSLYRPSNIPPTPESCQLNVVDQLFPPLQCSPCCLLCLICSEILPNATNFSQHYQFHLILSIMGKYLSLSIFPSRLSGYMPAWLTLYPCCSAWCIVSEGPGSFPYLAASVSLALPLAGPEPGPYTDPLN